MPESHCGFTDTPDGKIRGSDLLGLTGPTIGVDIGFDAAYVVAGGVIPKPAINGVMALVDTGAGECCIDADLAKSINLPVIDRRPISGSNGSHMVDVHLAQIHVPSLNFTVYGAFCAVALTAGWQQHKALLGRTFLAYFTMIYTGKTGEVRIFS